MFRVDTKSVEQISDAGLIRAGRTSVVILKIDVCGLIPERFTPFPPFLAAQNLHLLARVSSRAVSPLSQASPQAILTGNLLEGGDKCLKRDSLPEAGNDGPRNRVAPGQILPLGSADGSLNVSLSIKIILP